MKCPACDRVNLSDARFCGGCGTPLEVRCPACGRQVDAGDQFCVGCGTALREARITGREGRHAEIAAVAVARKIVTIVFADLVGSTSLHERLDAESVRHLMDRYYRSLHAVIAAHGGTVVKLLGDGVMAAFGIPRVAEDDAIRAVRAAAAIVEEVRANALAVRVGVNTGEVVVSSDNDDVVGDPVNVAARLQQEARAGHVLIGEATRRLVNDRVTLEPFGELALKGRSESVPAYRVVSLERPAGAPALAFVGRDDELRRVTAVYDAAVGARAARLAVVLGSPGLGKSRLVEEFTRRLADGVVVINAHCESADRSTFAPLADALRRLLRLDDSAGGAAVRAAIESRMPSTAADRARVAAGVAALIAGTPASPEETFFVVRRFLAALATERSLVLVIDDLQWAEPLLLDLTEHLVQWSTDTPLLVLVAARPELRDLRASLASPGGMVTDVITLAGLDAGAATRLVASAAGGDELPAAVAGRVLATSEGNPLFVGELVRMLVDDGTLKREGNRWTITVALADLEMPPTIHALLAARIERLRPEDRVVLERAAVVGRHFSRAAVAHLLPREIDDLDARLESLRRSELIDPDAGWFLGEAALRFHHMLIRDAAYRRLLKGTRAELHARFADWAEAKVGDMVEHEETIGWHLERAHQLLGELGAVDSAGRAFGERAARYLAAAGRRALERDDIPRAANLLGRALARLDTSAPGRAELALDWCEALLAAGDVGQAAKAIEELARFAGSGFGVQGSGFGGDRGRGAAVGKLELRNPDPGPRAGGDSDRLRAWHTCFAGQLAVLTNPAILRDTAAAVAAAAAVLARLADAGGEAKAHYVHAAALARLGEIGACEAALDRALDAARRAGDRRRANAVLAGAPIAALWGPSPMTRASGRCLDVVRVLRITQGAPGVEAVALRCQAVLEALRGRTDAARRMIASSRRMVEELGITQQLLDADVYAGLIELLGGDTTAAEGALRRAYQGLRDQGLAIDAARAAALLGRALLAQGRAADAETVSRESEALAGDDLKASSAWRGVRAEALAQRGEHAAAVDLARQAVEIAAATDALLDHADARRSLAIALRAAGRDAEADAEEARAVELWETKGAAVLANRLRRGRGERAVTDEAVRLESEPEPGPSAPRFANAATLSQAIFERCWRSRDLDGVLATYSPAIVMDDRRKLVGVRLAGEAVFDNLRFLFRNHSSVWQSELLATRGDRLALFRMTFFGEMGLSVERHLGIVEVDDDGRVRMNVAFDPEEFDAAYAALDELFAAGEAAPYPAAFRTFQRLVASIRARDWEQLASVFVPDLVTEDHRPLGWGTLRCRDEYVRRARTLLELRPDTVYRVDHLSADDARGALAVVRWSGAESAGSFDISGVSVSELDPDGRVRRWDFYGLDQLDEARRRYAGIRSGAGATPAQFEEPAGHALRVPPDSAVAARRTWISANAASRLRDRVTAAFMARDWEAMRALASDDMVFEDRRRFSVMNAGIDLWLKSAAAVQSASGVVFADQELVGAVGDRIEVRRRVVSGTGPDGGPFEIEFLVLTAIGADGKLTASINFDAEARDEALAEARKRFLAAETGPAAAGTQRDNDDDESRSGSADS